MDIESGSGNLEAGFRFGLGVLRVRGVVDFDLTLLTLVRNETFL